MSATPLRAPSLASLAPLAGAHHERLDGSGSHREMAAAGLAAPARLLAAADAYHAMTEPRAHRAAIDRGHAGQMLAADCRAGLTTPMPWRRCSPPPGSLPPSRATRGADRARSRRRTAPRAGAADQAGCARAGVSAKTADRHVQNAPYAKIGVSTRAGATLFALQHGLLAWGELPMVGTPEHF